ncbi:MULTISPECIES: RES family NAD+ phosphorylase [unclassified Polaribacter]|uniref:RES family NAD+ phosphorylase n=1 Tax=unclassified Polaribacter TaxID=196858 RepID=UPI0011BFB22D|nr:MULTISPECIES: RES family NAD+ phosphorylase [unclassified Polaribacter]TXD50740.1 RES domain-containing protein [Polaribacter sp. IC063]TXD57405.1 RES domain-containing protein [Polaribacter sp. IC066]
MRVYRIEREKYLETTLKGFGTATAEAYRRNSLNTYLVYTAESRTLAILEVSVHLDFSEDLPTDRYYVEMDIPDEIEILELKTKDLPSNWDTHPPSLETQYIGDDFVKNNEAAVLKMASCIVPLKYNFLINLKHFGAKRITVVARKQLTFDKRFKKVELQ